MNEDEAKLYLKDSLNFSLYDLERLEKFRKYLLEYNKKYNLISSNTEETIWSRHILDSAQILRFLSVENNIKIVDLGSGAGFPGIIIAILSNSTKLHVKLFEKSPVKREFLNIIKKKLDLKVVISNNVNDEIIDGDIIVSRAFKKLDQIIRISRENAKKPHKLIILKGKNAEAEINKVSLDDNYSYKLEKSVTDIDSKIIIIDVKKNGQ